MNKTISVEARGYYRREKTTTLRAKRAADGTLLISARAYRAAHDRCCYAGDDSLVLSAVDGYHDWNKALGNMHQGTADEKILPTGIWYAKPIAGKLAVD